MTNLIENLLIDSMVILGAVIFVGFFAERRSFKKAYQIITMIND